MDWEKYTGKKSVKKDSAAGWAVVGSGPTGEKITTVNPVTVTPSENRTLRIQPQDDLEVFVGEQKVYPTIVSDTASWSDVQPIAGKAIESGELVAYKSDDTVEPVLTQEEMTPTFDEIWADITDELRAEISDHAPMNGETIERAMRIVARNLYDRLMEEIDARTP